MVADSWGNTANGAPCRQSAWNGGVNQHWRLNPMGSGRYRIVNRGTSTALDGTGSTTAGSVCALWAPNTHTDNQRTIVAV
ncbi:RICIN domain-containing protein [Catellatospora sp. KI3]|uniref:RICIN domain-containing protein n=1 Tax=Catellatospora sp. KI3 TaxID=3041620 RepID=UPI002482E2BD|nr:RICIN domain-containing protein [Catellatospora sp. KI3]MDI1460779.1 RICIN domain-containing protein [Catellatospora sp. KI3]